MIDIHKNIGNFEDNRCVHVVDGVHFIYTKTLCAPNTEILPWEVYTDEDKNVTCRDCLELMETANARD